MTEEEFRCNEVGGLRQVSYCYSADLVDDTGETTLEPDEVADMLSHSWMSVEDAKKLMAEVEPTSDLGRSIKERDIFVLEEATKSAD
jgi:8-oxo-dGTP diphosphatase